MMRFLESDLGGPFDLILGLPLHPLAVHAAVVLVPLVAIAALIMSYLPSFSRRYGKFIFSLAIIAQISLFVAKQSGESFAERINVEIGRHEDLGTTATFIAIPMLILIYTRWRMDREGANIGSASIRRLVSILLALSALAALTYVALAGHSGAELVWGWVSKS
jgi:uncharacterized membrane protein